MTSVFVFLLMILAVFCIAKRIYNFIRAAALRFVFKYKLRTICNEKKYKIKFLRNPILSFFKISSIPDVTVKTNEAEYLLRFITCRNRKRIWYFINDKIYVRVFRVFFATPGAPRHAPIDLSKKLGHIPPIDKKYADPRTKNMIPVLLFNPSPVEINYLDEENQKLVAGNGSVIHGQTVYNANGFLNILGGRE